MAQSNYKQVSVYDAITRFEKAPQSRVEHSRMSESVTVMTAFNAGDLIPLRCFEMVPNQTWSVHIADVIRQITMKVPTMGEMICDVYAFFVPNRVVNKSWKNVMGENTSGTWYAPSVQCAPLLNPNGPYKNIPIQIPVGSVADYYGLPTQGKLTSSLLSQMNDFPFRGYLSIYNEYFRDQNYQPPIPFSKLNVYEGFLEPVGSFVPLNSANQGSGGTGVDLNISTLGGVVSDGSYGSGAVLKEVYGEGGEASDMSSTLSVPSRRSSWSALSKPLKANKFHDALTSVLPSPQRGEPVTFSLVDSAPMQVSDGQNIQLGRGSVFVSGGTSGPLYSEASGSGGAVMRSGSSTGEQITSLSGTLGLPLTGTVDLSEVSAISVDELRLGFAMQQYYELLGRSGSRMREIVHALFGIDVDDPYDDIPRLLGHWRHPLELFQTAQTSASTDGSPQGNLAGFGYTNRSGFLFHYTAIEPGYVHILCTIRQRNVYPSFLDPSWFRTKQLDFYNPILANISEQPVYTRVINPFSNNPSETVFGYQEAWWDYRQHPNTVTGVLRSGVSESLSLWTYQDLFDDSIETADASFMESNAQEVLDVTLAYTSDNAPQFQAMFTFKIDDDFPGPVYSVPGLDII